MKNTCLLLLSCILLLISCEKDNDPSQNTVCPGENLEDLHLTLGNPDNAVTDLNSPNSYLIKLPQYAVSYNRDRGIPNWVSWHLSKDWLGSADRQDDFKAYPFLPTEWFTVDEFAYENSGFNRGHNCPSADRLCSDEFNSATFFMINMIPQAPLHNQEIWRELESFTRDLIRDDKEAYVIMGNYGEGGFGFFGYATSIADGKITVPLSIWKVIVVLPEGEDDLSRIDENTTVIALDIQNADQTIDYELDDFRVSVDEIEEKTGMDLFSNLPQSVQEVLEAKVYEGGF